MCRVIYEDEVLDLLGKGVAYQMRQSMQVVCCVHDTYLASWRSPAPPAKMVPTWSQNAPQDDVPDGARKKLEN